MDDIKRILVFSESAIYYRNAIHYGILLAKRHEAELYVIHDIDNLFGLKGWDGGAFPSHDIFTEKYRSMLKETKTVVDNMINAERARGMFIEVIITTGVTVDEEISRIVQNKKIDLLIMRAHKNWRLERFLFCRSNEEIIIKMPCAITLLKDELKPLLIDEFRKQ